MKIKSLAIISLAIFCQSVFPQSKVSVNEAKQWMEQRFAKGVVPPFSFVYGGKKSGSFIKNWQYQSEKVVSAEQNQETYVYRYSDKTTGLVINCTVTCFTDFPAIEWVLNFSNTSGKNTPLIENVAAVDNSFIAGKNGDFILHHSLGCGAKINDFQPLEELMQVGKNIYMTPDQGHSSSGTALPFFNIEMPGGRGTMVAVGWTGKWYADVVLKDAKTVSLKSGMEKIHLTLYPKEEIRTPKICLLFWEGENRMVGHNQFRQFILTHHSRKINGQFAEYPLNAGLRFGDDYPCPEFECATEDYLISIVKRYQFFDIVPEAFWLDAGWYEGAGWGRGDWWETVGSWYPDKKRFPNGLRLVADAIHEAGAKFLVWFEPERVMLNSIIGREHTEWLINGPHFYMFDMGNKDARIWMTDHITAILKKEGIDIYRQDFNMDPYPYWTSVEKSDRIGIPEIRHIEGLYAFWDSLLVRFPNLLIDNCAGGGRRIDLETTSRSAPLWRTDYAYGESNGSQCHTYTLNFYLPIHGTGFSRNDDYAFHSGLSATLIGQNWLVGRGRETVEVSRKYMQEYKTIRPYFYGDYYPLTFTDNYTSADMWLAYQLNRPQQKDGIILAFRRIDNGETSIRIKLSGIEKDVVYELYYEDGTQTHLKGSELMNGFDITISSKPASLLIKYRQGIESIDQ